MYKKCIKRLMDIFFSFAGIIFLSPIMLITALMIRKKLGSSVIFAQNRPGYKEKIFKLYKFRTMTEEHDSNGKLLSDEERLGSFGRKLRASSLDELPELFNILKGDMSIVGPRPLLVRYLERYNAEQKHRHDVKPGLTGLAQVNGRNAISWEDKFKFDISYVNNVTFLEDLKIIIKTIINVIRHEGINSGTSATMEEFMGSQNESK